jgi:hypothetical protein
MPVELHRVSIARIDIKGRIHIMAISGTGIGSGFHLRTSAIKTIKTAKSTAPKSTAPKPTDAPPASTKKPAAGTTQAKVGAGAKFAPSSGGGGGATAGAAHVHTPVATTTAPHTHTPAPAAGAAPSMSGMSMPGMDMGTHAHTEVVPPARNDPRFLAGTTGPAVPEGDAPTVTIPDGVGYGGLKGRQQNAGDKRQNNYSVTDANFNNQLGLLAADPDTGKPLTYVQHIQTYSAAGYLETYAPEVYSHLAENQNAGKGTILGAASHIMGLVNTADAAEDGIDPASIPMIIPGTALDARSEVIDPKDGTGQNWARMHHAETHWTVLKSMVDMGVDLQNAQEFSGDDAISGAGRVNGVNNQNGQSGFNAGELQVWKDAAAYGSQTGKDVVLAMMAGHNHDTGQDASALTNPRINKELGLATDDRSVTPERAAAISAGLLNGTVTNNNGNNNDNNGDNGNNGNNGNANNGTNDAGSAGGAEVATGAGTGEIVPAAAPAVIEGGGVAPATVDPTAFDPTVLDPAAVAAAQAAVVPIADAGLTTAEEVPAALDQIATAGFTAVTPLPEDQSTAALTMLLQQLLVEMVVSGNSAIAPETVDGLRKVLASIKVGGSPELQQMSQALENFLVQTDASGGQTTPESLQALQAFTVAIGIATGRLAPTSLQNFDPTVVKAASDFATGLGVPIAPEVQALLDQAAAAAPTAVDAAGNPVPAVTADQLFPTPAIDQAAIGVDLANGGTPAPDAAAGASMVGMEMSAPLPLPANVPTELPTHNHVPSVHVHV